jgi:hypothetical protein
MMEFFGKMSDPRLPNLYIKSSVVLVTAHCKEVLLYPKDYFQVPFLWEIKMVRLKVTLKEQVGR